MIYNASLSNKTQLKFIIIHPVHDNWQCLTASNGRDVEKGSGCCTPVARIKRKLSAIKVKFGAYFCHNFGHFSNILTTTRASDVYVFMFLEH